ncbi:transposase [Bradyrhizobium sp. 195]|nr:transposase [Bradyrhizobium sp. 195]
MVATKPVDFRKGAEGLATLMRERMLADPFSGHGLCVPSQTRGPDQADLLGWNGSVPVCEALGGRHLPLAEDRRRRDRLAACP